MVSVWEEWIPCDGDAESGPSVACADIGYHMLPNAGGFSSGNGRIASWSTIVGFIIMMTLDVALG